MESIIVASPMLRLPNAPPDPPTGGETAELLRLLVNIGREQLQIGRAQLANQDDKARWKSMYSRHHEEFPTLPKMCQTILPAVERAYLNLFSELADRLMDEDADDLSNEFALAEFLDRYSPRLAQLGNVLGLVGQLSQAAPPPPETA